MLLLLWFIFSENCGQIFLNYIPLMDKSLTENIFKIFKHFNLYETTKLK